ncbi:MAG: hypothetical protein FJY98_03850 [Candidatus Liptonbacteria bacterium]|nr:hypothetical protein [Candidatus Liptonbacteria bacterium]
MNSPILGMAIGGLTRKWGITEAVRLVREAGYNAIELSPKHNVQVLRELAAAELDTFSYVSIHAPILPYGNNAATREVFEEFAKFHARRPIKLAVFHPDPVEDFDVFRSVPFPVAFENMDWRKTSHRTVEDMQKVMTHDPHFKFVLDVNHIYTNDKTMALAQEFLEALHPRLAEVHLSGFTTIHDPLYHTKQDFLITLVKDLSQPIILEGVGEKEELRPEREYVLQLLG